MNLKCTELSFLVYEVLNVDMQSDDVDTYFHCFIFRTMYDQRMDHITSVRMQS